MAGACTICGQGCPVKLKVLNGNTIVGVSFNMEPNRPQHYAVCGKVFAIPYAHRHPRRIKRPMIREGQRGSGSFRPVSWDEALDYVAQNLQKFASAPHQLVFFSHQGWEAPIMDEFARLMKTPNVTDHADTCFHGSAAGRWFLFGRFVGPGATYPDYEHAQFVVFMGRNPYGGIVAAPWTKSLSEAVSRGLRVVVFDVRYSEICEVAERYYLIKPGTDLAVSLAIAREIIVNKLYNADYLNSYTNASMLFYHDTVRPVRLRRIESGDRADKLDYLVYCDVDKMYRFKGEAKRAKLDFSGIFEGKRVITALRILGNALEKYTPEWAESISGVDSEEIMWIARTLASYGSRAFIDPGYKSVRYYNEPMLHRVNALINVLIGSWGSKGGVAWSRKLPVPIPLPEGGFKVVAGKC
ncbi:MAG: molybdopterin-dependent oxidoreductase [Thaumarchaeota archaeon]|nr:molybdopterin-dependent oxidoreductase [Candidatus Calditenuaceae archaeon]MDW8041999.1 molybdopterin-dependent oxidoreductase [Nitrososphaerota archaeon]